ncbi:MAG TPA: TrmH family RNA methyltransferase [Acidobacteriaceae bacterium]|nr:TrmH family RNA methyltransferase [Acidobacteriaceae bacterium]
MLTPEQCERVDVVLVSPRNPLNIGAAARAMANFGFQRLSIVAPFAQNWMEAKSAVGAPDLLRDAKVYETLAEAVAHCTLVLGTGSLDRRRPVQTILGLPEAAAQIRSSVIPTGAEQKSDHVALVFGSEKHGLTSDDLSWCQALIVIETHDDQPSMNLGQAVAVCLYEISRTPGATSQSHASELQSSETPTKNRQNADSGQLDRLAALVEETMEAANYSTRGMRSANGEALRVLLRRLMPNEPDLRRMMGLFRRILWQLGRGSGKS